MKIQILDQNTKKPLANGKLQLQVRGKDSGYLSATTDANGYLTLDDKYKGQQIALANAGGQGGSGQGGKGGQGGQVQGQWIQANEGAKLFTSGADATTAAGGATTSTTKY